MVASDELRRPPHIYTPPCIAQVVRGGGRRLNVQAATGFTGGDCSGQADIYASGEVDRLGKGEIPRNASVPAEILRLSMRRTPCALSLSISINANFREGAMVTALRRFRCTKAIRGVEDARRSEKFHAS